MGLFSRKQTPKSEPRQEVREPEAAASPASQRREQLPTDGPLRRLVDGLLVDGAQRGKLTLVQRGSTMSYQSERAAAGGSAETDSGVVDQASPLFDDVAALYTESMNAPTGAWQTVVISAGAEEAGSRRVTVDYDFPSADHRTDEYELGGGTGGADRGAAQGSELRVSDARGAEVPRDGGTSQDAASRGPLDGDRDRRSGASAAAVGAGAAAGAAAGRSGDQEDRVRVVDSASRDADRRDEDRSRGADERGPQLRGSDLSRDEGRPSERSDADRPGDGSAGTGALAGSGIGTGAAAGGAAAGRDSEQDRVPEGQLTEDGTVDNLAPRQQGQEPIEVDREVQESVARTAGHQSTAGSDTGRHFADEQDGRENRASGGSGDQVPSHVDHDEWRDDQRGARGAGAAPTGAAAARSASTPDEAGAPTIASGADVAPSYRAAEQAAGGDELAQGNKVLSRKEIARRVAGAQKRLFGPEGSARDVSTVLVRVRTLGTYYDALTHVRQGGFWDQRSTFDLIPEEDLQVQSLKQDSYVEGEGAPLAIMFRFRAGIPPEVSFDYDDEEAFVRYENRLPSQNYVEELRMYPRTGANIPQHVNDALQDWNY